MQTRIPPSPRVAHIAVRLTGVRKTRKQYRLRAFAGAAFRVLSLVVLASAPSRNNPVMGGVLLTGAAGEMPAGWASRLEPPKPPPEQMAKVPGFLGDREVTSL